MDRRGARFVIDPKVRQVGFFTPGADLPTSPSSAESSSPGSTPDPNPKSESISVISLPTTINPPVVTTLADISFTSLSSSWPHPLSPDPNPDAPFVEEEEILPLHGSYVETLDSSSLHLTNGQSNAVTTLPSSIQDSSLRIKAISAMESFSLKEDRGVMGSSSLKEGRTAVESLSLKEDRSVIERLSLKEDRSTMESFSLKDHRIVYSPSASGSAEILSRKKQQEKLEEEEEEVEEEVSSMRGGTVPKKSETSADEQVSAKSLKERTTKAERRAKQEADREAKRAAREKVQIQVVEHEAGNVSKSSKTQTQRKEPNVDKKLISVAEKPPEKDKKKEIPAPRMQFDDEHRVAKAKKKALFEQTETKNRVELFRHLPQFVHGTQLPNLEVRFFHDDAVHPHPAIYQVGLRYVTGDIVGGNARCVAMLLAFRQIIKNYSTPKEKTLVRDLTVRINSNVSFLTTCRPLSISMGNAIKFLKTRIAKLPITLSESESKSQLISNIDQFIHEKITFADKEITKHAVTKIRDGDVILTYSSSCVVESILLHAFELGRKFRVIVVDSRPKLEGKRLLRRLLGSGISCTYTHINAISYVMQEATKVFLGASSILSNGTVYSRVGSASVGMVAHAFLVPVIICCETYKFHERVQLDSICSNELGDPDALVNVPGRKDLSDLSGWSHNSHLQLLNLIYDTMPADYVSMIVTELGMVPPTSVPVILREYRKEPMM